jgi:hypothetical protein
MWKFGEAPLEETERYAALVRRVSSLVLQMEGPSEVVAELCDALERAANDRRIESTARLFDGEVLCAAATMRAVAGNLAALPPVSSRRRL